MIVFFCEYMRLAESTYSRATNDLNGVCVAFYRVYKDLRNTLADFCGRAWRRATILRSKNLAQTPTPFQSTAPWKRSS